LQRNLADDNKGFGYALSLEAGQRIALNQHWTLTPQAQLVYLDVRFNSFTDPFGAAVSLADGASLRGRLGLAAEYQQRWKQDNGTVSRISAYGIANLYNEFLDGMRVNVSGTQLASRDDRLWGGVGLGGSYNWNDNKYSVYGEVMANTALAHFGDSFTIGGTVGVRVKW
jgi:outer membrane autotransporter protein